MDDRHLVGKCENCDEEIYSDQEHNHDSDNVLWHKKCPERDEFKLALESLINKYSLEGGSDTPDFILADYLVNCLAAFNVASKERGRWYS